METEKKTMPQQSMSQLPTGGWMSEKLPLQAAGGKYFLLTSPFIEPANKSIDESLYQAFRFSHSGLAPVSVRTQTGARFGSRLDRR